MDERARKFANMIDKNLATEVLREALVKAACDQIDTILSKKYNTMLRNWAENTAEQSIAFKGHIAPYSKVAANVDFVKYFAARFTG